MPDENFFKNSNDELDSSLNDDYYSSQATPAAVQAAKELKACSRPPQSHRKVYLLVTLWLCVGRGAWRHNNHLRANMQITSTLLKEYGACSSGYDWFTQRFPDGGEYQAVLDAACDDDHPDWAQWLLNKAGAIESLYEADALTDRKHFVFAGSIRIVGMIQVSGFLSAGWGIEAGSGIEAGKGIKAGEGIKAGSGIEAGWGIEAGEGIKAGEGIEAGEGIKAGYDFGIFAGLRVRIMNWTIYARVSAKTKPENLISGYWQPSAEQAESSEAS